VIDRRQWIHGVAAAGGMAMANAIAGCGWRPHSVEPRLITRLARPYCAEPALRDLCRSWITPVEHFYVLNHGSVPRLDARRFRLRVRGRVARELSLSLAELRRDFPRVELTATLMCAGNRRRAMHARRTVDSVPLWGPGAVGNARWAGAPLAAVLERAGVAEGAAHICLEGLDRVDRMNGEVTRFAGSIPLARARHGSPPPILLAYEMNGAPLARRHGFPLRVVAPGMIGARSVKWLGAIELSSRPSDNIHFLDSHRLVSAADGLPRPAPPIYEFPPTAAMFAAGGAVSGYALVGGRDHIDRVEVSTDGGRSWRRAAMIGPDRPGCWRLWRADSPRLVPGTRVVARAITVAGARMPRRPRWNRGGYLHNAWARVDL
jgi:sulfite oxidase